MLAQPCVGRQRGGKRVHCTSYKGVRMKQLVGYVLAICGGLLMAWVIVAGGGFTAITAMGCIGTSWREGCRQMGWLLGATLAGVLLGWVLYRAGRSLIRSARAQARLQSGRPI